MQTFPDRPFGDHDALALVRTPLQLLNAVEARRHFGFARTALMIVEYGGVGLPPFDRSCIDPADWTGVQVVDLNPVPRPWPYRWLDHPRLAASEKANVLRQCHRRRVFERALRPWRGVPHVLLGNYLQGWFRHAAWRCARAECILLDDGTDTLRIAALRPRGEKPAPPLSIRRRPKAWWYRRYAAWEDRQREQVTFFSSFELDLPPQDRHVANTYRHSRRRLQSAGRDRRCLFLGQPLVEDGYLAAADHADLLAAVKASLAGHDLFYVPHRREDPALVAPLLRRLQIAELRLDRAFEYWLLSAPTVPAAVASFFSSALDTCRLIAGDALRILAFRLPADRLLVAHDYVAQVYGYFADIAGESIEIVEPGRPLGGPDRP